MVGYIKLSSDGEAQTHDGVQFPRMINVEARIDDVSRADKIALIRALAQAVDLDEEGWLMLLLSHVDPELVGLREASVSVKVPRSEGGVNNA